MKNKKSYYPLIISKRYLPYVLEITDRLNSLKRTGWVDRNVEHPETVGEHTDELVAMAESLFDIPGLSMMLRIHDWAESEKNVGDRRTDSFCPADHRFTKEEKYEAEFDAMVRICHKLGSYGKVIMRLWLEYEERETRRGQIAYQLDKLQTIRKAIWYQKQNQPVIAQEFIDNDGPKISHPFIRKLLEEAISGI
jgi:5'-deoxynucleotidase YfbR-like HD superfamily hydrolase